MTMNVSLSSQSFALLFCWLWMYLFRLSSSLRVARVGQQLGFVVTEDHFVSSLGCSNTWRRTGWPFACPQAVSWAVEWADLKCELDQVPSHHYWSCRSYFDAHVDLGLSTELIGLQRRFCSEYRGIEIRTALEWSSCQGLRQSCPDVDSTGGCLYYSSSRSWQLKSHRSHLGCYVHSILCVGRLLHVDFG